jgi:ribosomal protein S18 acetylase RimI-like enzyme
MVRTAVIVDFEQLRLLNPAIDQAGKECIEKAICAGECLVVEQDGVAAAYGCMGYRFFERGFVWVIYVPAHLRRRGLASQLFDRFEEQCNSARIFISTNLSNLPMQALLRSRKYILSGIVQDLDDGDPELFYSKRLK